MHSATASRWLAMMMTSAILFGAGATSPAFVLADEPSPPPAEQPDVTPPPADEPAAPGPLPVQPPSAAEEPPGVERLDLRTESSQTFEQADGTFISQFFDNAVFYHPEGSSEWSPIDLTIQPTNRDGASAAVDTAPTHLALFAADNSEGFLRVDAGGRSISLGLPAGVTAGRPGVQPQIREEGLFADYLDFLPGGIGLRVFPQSDGFTTYIMLASRPASNTFSLAIDAPGLRIAPEDEFGNFALFDAQGAIVGRLPRPFMLDSSDLVTPEGESRGGGAYSEAVSQVVTADGERWLLTLTVDPAYLDEAVYPVYIDPTTTTFPTGSTTANDTFANSQAPNTNFNTYQRPDSPYYSEMWHGRTPNTAYYNEVYIRFNDLESTLTAGHIDSAELQMYPYWQFNHTNFDSSWIERVQEDWGAGTLKWNNRPATDASLGEYLSKQGVWTDWDVSSFVQDVVNGTVPNNGLMIHANSILNQGWKRFVSRNDSSNLKPKLVVTWSAFAAPAVLYPNGGGETSSRTLNWTLPSGSAQGAYEAQIATNSGFSTGLVSSGTVTSSTPAHMIPVVTTLTEGTTYYWRVKVKYGNNSSFSGWSDTGTFTYRQNATLGLPGHDTFESFSLGNGDIASVNVTTGNLVISHPIVSLSLRGGSFGLALTYNSQSTVNSGTGLGWRLSAMRRLAELGGGNAVLTAGDGSVHTFAKISTVGTVTTYTRPSTFYATLRKDTANTLEWTLTYPDQSVDSFDVFGSEGLLAKQADRSGNSITFTYYSSSNRLKDATDPNSRVVDFTWDTGASPARLTTITDWAYVSGGVVQSSATGSRRAHRLFYDGSGNLAGWSNPLNTSGSCPTMASNLTCLTIGANGLVATIKKRQTIATLSAGAIGTSNRDVTTTIYYRGGEVSQVRDPEQTNSAVTGTTLSRTAADKLTVIRQGAPASTTTYGFVAVTDALARVGSTKRKLGGTDIEQLTTWDSTYPTERASVTDNYGALLSTPARTVSYTFAAGTSGPLVLVVTEPLTGATSRTTTYTYNANNDVTQVVVASGGSSTTTRYCYTTSGCSTSGTELTMNSLIENYVDGSKGGGSGNVEDVTTDYLYDAYGRLTRETRYDYDPAGTLLDNRATGYTYDANGNQTGVIANYADGSVTSPGDDIDPNATTKARTDLTSATTFDTAGNAISSADPRRAIETAKGTSLNADDYISRTEYDAMSQATKNTAPRDPADASAPKYTPSAYDELGALRSWTDFGGLVSATEYDRAGRATRTFEDTDGAGGASATTTSSTTYDASGRPLTVKDRNQVGDASLGTTALTYDELGRATYVEEAQGSSPDVSSTTVSVYDALDRQECTQVGWTTGGCDYLPADGQSTMTAYDLGGRATSVDDEFACTTTTYDYRGLALTETSGLDTGCSSGAEQRTVTNTYDGLGRLTRSAVTAGSDSGNWTFDATLDSAGRQLTSGVKTGCPTSCVSTTTTFTLNPLDQVIVEARPDGSTSKSNFDAVGNSTDACYWKPSITVGDCNPVTALPWTNQPTQVTTSAYDARNNRVAFTDSATGTTTTYDPDHNYAIKAFYVPTGSGKEHQTLYGYDARHRLATVGTKLAITQQLCVLDASTSSDLHDCTSTTPTASDDYLYDDNDNRTKVDESNGNTSSDQRYCYDALNRLQYRQTGSACSSSSKNEEYAYDSGGNRTKTVISGTTTNFAYNSKGQLCKIGATSCGTPNVTYDSAGRTWSLSGWVYEYDAEGRLTRACKSTSCTGSIDKVEFAYDGEGHRTQIKEYTAGSLTTTRDFLYQGDAIVQEKTNGTISREYVVDDAGAIVRFCDPNCASPTASYLVNWNGHGDALAAWRINGDGTLTLANSFTYSSWGTPTTATHNSIADLGFRFLYVGAYDVQWDNFSGLGLYYMHARHYSPALGRFLQPDPARADLNTYAYAASNPMTNIDPSGLRALEHSWGGGGAGFYIAVRGNAVRLIAYGAGVGVGGLTLAWGARYLQAHTLREYGITTTVPRYVDCPSCWAINYGAGRLVSDILKGKRGDIKQARLPKGSPGWREIETKTWGEIEAGAIRNLPGYRTIKKLLTQGKYNK